MAAHIAKIILYLCRFVTGVQVNLRDLDIFTGVQVFYSNHSSHLDAMVVLSLLPVNVRNKTYIVGSKKYWQSNPLRRFIANKVFNTIMIDRASDGHTAGAFSAISNMTKVLEEGKSIIIFPEGARNSSDDISEFKGGIYHLAKNVKDVKFVPVYLENMNRIMPKGELIVIPIIGRAVFGSSILYQEGDNKQDFLARARKQLADLGVNEDG